MFRAVLDGEGPDVGVAGQPVAEKFRRIIQPCVALLLNDFRSVGDGLLHELDDIGLGLKSVTRRIVALAEVRPEVGSGNPPYQDEIQCGGVADIVPHAQHLVGPGLRGLWTLSLRGEPRARN